MHFSFYFQIQNVVKWMHPLPIQRLVFWWNRSFPKCVNCSGCSSESTTTSINNNYNHSKTKPPSSKISTTVTTTTRKETAVTTRRNPQNNSNNNIRKLTMTIISHSIVVAVHFFLASKSVSQSVEQQNKSFLPTEWT